ncbi:hypothetical protein [Geomicrobium sp. JCM 19038]|uniref:hypothetical protein n=1 Tax=Geomicrobium sp. JCM 19038 TaxID=1460635 RepID=UPI00045F2787|nr:hypothetical protein [Geomicrobium sp. JCM 19038]GAK08493.1 hypothetical protein JCM19038_2277 [Geomicrobium sp. JCM 19038]
MIKVITLCGSTKFKQQFDHANAMLTLEGHAVISVGFFEQCEGIEISNDQLRMLEEILLRKIDLADEVMVIDPTGYIGDSTSNEITYAKQSGKKVTYYSQMSWLDPKEAN